MADTIKLQKTEEEKKAEASPKGDVINLRDKVTVYSTDKDPHHKTGDPIVCHPKIAQDIVKRGLATEAKTSSSKKDKGSDDIEI